MIKLVKVDNHLLVEGFNPLVVGHLRIHICNSLEELVLSTEFLDEFIDPRVVVLNMV